MQNKRCPWCAKKISSGSTLANRIKIGLMPVRTCKHCSGAFSSSASTWIIFLALMVTWAFFAGSVLEFIIICILLAAAIITAVLLALFDKYTVFKLGADGKRAERQDVKYSGKTDEKNIFLRKGDLLLTDIALDESPAFWVTAPIQITKYSQKTGKTEFVFLYEHTDNLSVIKGRALKVYSEKEEEPIYISEVAEKTNK